MPGDRRRVVVTGASGHVGATLVRDLLARGDRVALYLQNVPQFVVAALAAWKLGAIAVSVNPMLKEREVRTLLDDCEPVALVTLESLWEQVARAAVADTSVRVVVIEGQVEQLAREHAGQAPPDPDLGPGDIAFLTYTSGTTGPPKGAMNTHGNVTFTAQVYRDWTHAGRDGAIFGIAPLFHITGLIGHIAVSMLVPAPLILAYRFEPNVVLDAFAEHRPAFTIGAITASVVTAVLM